jgi:hypothetical protein
MPNGRAGGTRWLDVAPDRLPGWLASFARRHGGLAADPSVTDEAGQHDCVTFPAADGAIAECHVPFPPLPPAALPPATALADLPAAMAAHACADRLVGVFLVRLGGYAAGVFGGPGEPALLASKVGSRLVHGGDKRTMAGLDGDPRLRPCLDLAVDRFLTVPDPRLAVLKTTPPMFRAIRIRLTEPGARA